jgi:hypothetical protein
MNRLTPLVPKQVPAEVVVELFISLPYDLVGLSFCIALTYIDISVIGAVEKDAMRQLNYAFIL